MENIKLIGYAIAFACGWLCDYTGIKSEVITILAVMILIDTLFGLIKSFRLKTTSSTKLSVGVMSKLVLLIIPIAISLTGIATKLNLNSVVIGTLNVFILAELYSIVVNAYIIRTGQDMKEHDFIALTLKKIKGLLEKLLEKS